MSTYIRSIRFNNTEDYCKAEAMSSCDVHGFTREKGFVACKVSA